MKNLFLILSFAAITFSLQSCNDDELSCIRAGSNNITEPRDLENFHSIVINTVGNLKITQGPEFDVKLTGPDNVVPLILTDVQNNVLNISSQNCFNGSYELVIEITAPDIRLISMAGVGNIETTNTIASEEVTIQLTGIGDVNATLNVEKVHTLISGQGTITYTGLADFHELICSGQFSLKSYDLITNHTSIRIIGSGDSEITANENLDVVIEGSGNVYYKGSPQINSNITGSGAVINAN